jgi:hypothetical protein
MVKSMGLKNYQHTAHYTYIDEALRARWNAFLALEKDMDSFVPQPSVKFQAQRNAEVERLRLLNPDAPITELAEFVDRQMEFRASDRWQFHERFDRRLMSEYVAVIMLSQALSEALINAILAIGLAHTNSVEVFPLIEKAEFKQKWLVGPKCFAPDYKFPHGGGIHETLSMLSRQRNSLVHHNIELTVDDKKVLDGSGFERRTPAEERRWIRRYFSLPYDLAKFSMDSIREVPFMLLFDRSPVEVAREHFRAELSQ